MYFFVLKKKKIPQRLFWVCDWYLMYYVTNFTEIKQSMKPKIFNTENKPDYGEACLNSHWEYFCRQFQTVYF